jgi:hypothetical protein
MELREQGLIELKSRVAAAKVTLGLKTFRRHPGKGVTLAECPAVFMSEGMDRFTGKSDRTPLGYPARRELEVTFDILVPEGHPVDIHLLFRQVRSVIFANHLVVPKETFIQELRAHGPYGYQEIPGLAGMQLIVGLYYPDPGN